MTSTRLEQKTFLLLLVGITLAFGWILWPFYGAVFWAAILALMFAPLRRRLLRYMPRRPNLATFATLAICLVIVIIPVALISVSLVQEVAIVVQRMQSGELDIGRYAQQVLGSLPQWLTDLLARFGISDLGGLQEKFTASITAGGQAIATKALNIGQNTFDFIINFFVMLYLLYFLLRDGTALSQRIKEAIPLDASHKQQLLEKFTTVIRAVVKGNIVVAIVQGTLGGVALWFLGIHGAILWAVLMAFLSLLPAVGAGLVWGPVAIYFLATGAIAKGVGLVVWGVVVIGLVDNALRPLLVGKDTKMPDYVVLISTLGGMALFGLNGFVIGPVIAAMFIAVWALFAPSSRAADASAPARAAARRDAAPPPPAE
ncbi:AI-2E family transporter [Xylophilus sp. ASV27]|uniref:AI-2E family transporter n=1 Tax=Xylophilus sp. ASV27 TaxID=2795129 RepID=UPI0018ECE211|nr:AI-2E family transporter [Xylophilus sp. ASV27]